MKQGMPHVYTPPYEILPTAYIIALGEKAVDALPISSLIRCSSSNCPDRDCYYVVENGLKE